MSTNSSSAARVTVVDFEDEGIHAVYNGGPYLNLYAGDRAASPFHALNVWDYESDTARIENTPEAVRAEVREYIAESD